MAFNDSTRPLLHEPRQPRVARRLLQREAARFGAHIEEAFMFFRGGRLVFGTFPCVALVWAFAACSSGESSVAPSDAGSDASPDGDLTPLADAGDDAPDAFAPAQPCEVAPDVADYAGLDLSTPPSTAVAGCADGFVTSTGTLTLTLTAGEPAVLDAFEGNIRANGTVCASSDGTPATVANVTRIVITGSAGDDSLIVDLAPGYFGDALLGTDGAFAVDLGDGKDALAVRGTACHDRILASSEDAATTLDLATGAVALRAQNVESMLFSLGAGDDGFSAGGPSAATLPLVVYGDSGNDVLQGGAGADVLNGGDGTDRFEKGASADGPDILNGGAGIDNVTYENRTADVAITLCSSSQLSGCAAPECTCPGANGEASEGDVVVNIEDAAGGNGNDVIIGDENSNQLAGGPGADRLDGQGGGDQIYGGEGEDLLYGGDGDDTLVGGEGAVAFDGQGGDNICVCGAPPKTIQSCQLRAQCPAK
jgi:Ca2+-binding RTX toxin-like protein